MVSHLVSVEDVELISDIKSLCMQLVQMVKGFRNQKAFLRCSLHLS